MKLWVDDIRPAPKGYKHLYSVDEVTSYLETFMKFKNRGEWLEDVEIISLDNDAGDYNYLGGDYYKILDYIEMRGWDFPIHIHTMNPVARQRMKDTIKHNGWKELLDLI